MCLVSVKPPYFPGQHLNLLSSTTENGARESLNYDVVTSDIGQIGVFPLSIGVGRNRSPRLQSRDHQPSQLIRSDIVHQAEHDWPQLRKLEPGRFPTPLGRLGMLLKAFVVWTKRQVLKPKEDVIGLSVR